MSKHRMPRGQRIARRARSAPSLVRRPAVVAPLAVLVASGAMVAATSAALTGNPASAPADAAAPATTSAAMVDELPELPAEAPDVVQPAAGTLGAYADYAQAANEIPDEALVAYQRAASVMAKAAPECHLEWSLLAAIGRIASDHGGSDVAAVALVDAGRRAAPDTDGGTLDGDASHDLPVGPLRLLPATWTVVAVDGDDDGDRNPEDLDDASLAAGVVLCGNDRDLTRDGDFRDALHMFNTAPRYPGVVARLAEAYERQLGTGVDPGTLLAMAPTAPYTSTTTATEHSQSPDATTDPSEIDSTHPSPEEPGDDDDVASYPTDKPTGKPTDRPTEPTETPTPSDCATADAEETDDGADEEPSPSVSLTPCTSSATSPTASSMPSTGGPST